MGFPLTSIQAAQIFILSDSNTVVVPTLWTIMNSSYNYEYWENIYLVDELTPPKHFGSQTDIQCSFTYAVFILSFNILVSHNSKFVSFFLTFYWSTMNTNAGQVMLKALVLDTAQTLRRNEPSKYLYWVTTN